MMFNEDKKYTLREFLRHLSHIQDKEYQKRVWVRNEGPECQAFDDAVCDFFDIGDPILDNYKGFCVTEAQYNLLKNFRNKFREFSDLYDCPEEFIDTPEWEEIMDLAKEVLNSFDYPGKIKNQMVDCFVKNAKKFCARATQEKTQACAEEPKCNDLYEAISEILAEDGILKDRNDVGVTQEQFELLKGLSKTLRSFVDKYELDSAGKLTKRSMDVPEWREINNLSRQVVQAFDPEDKK